MCGGVYLLNNGKYKINIRESEQCPEYVTQNGSDIHVEIELDFCGAVNKIVKCRCNKKVHNKNDEDTPEDDLTGSVL